MKLFETENREAWIVEDDHYQNIEVSLSISSDNLSLQDISLCLQIQHSSGFERGDKYSGKISEREYIRSNGVWRYDSKNFVSSDKIKDHIDHILDIFEAKIHALKKYLSDQDYMVSLTIWVEEDMCITSVEIDKSTMIRLMNICNHIVITLGCREQHVV
jgi:hypothetical protein